MYEPFDLDEPVAKAAEMIGAATKVAGCWNVE